jgi:hypothetical protein
MQYAMLVLIDYWFLLSRQTEGWALLILGCIQRFSFWDAYSHTTTPPVLL